MTSTPPLVPASNVAGFRDCAGAELLAKRAMLDTIRAVYRLFGFEELETPAVEFMDSLLGPPSDEDTKSAKMIFETTRLRGRDAAGTGATARTALRFDLTVPLARYYSANRETLPNPYKRYQLGEVWRGEKPQAGRYCEFKQFDLDTVGCAGMEADAEVIAAMYTVMRALGVERFLIRVNNRKILNGLAGLAGFDPSLSAAVMTVMDKVDALGLDGVQAALTRRAEPPILSEEDKVGMEPADLQAYYLPPDEGWGAGISAEAAATIRSFMEISGSPEEILAQVLALCDSEGIMAEGANELLEVVALLDAAGLPRESWAIDLSVARGLGYYTGPVFETILLDLPNFGSVYSGGRYDDLVTRFLPYGVPAVGASIGVDRLFAALKELDQLELTTSASDVLVTVMDRAHMADYMAMATELREAGINTELYMGSENRLGGQIGFAEHRGIPLVLICGGREFEAGNVQLKNLRNPDRGSNQVTVPRSGLIQAAREELATHYPEPEEDPA